MKLNFTKKMFKNFSFTLLTFLSVLVSSAQTTFNYTGGMQTYVVPLGVTLVSVDVYGADGFGTLGRGGRVEATIPVTPGQTLNIFVGGEGTEITGGYNGGGNGGANTGYGGGGGASDIRIGGIALANRIIVAGGGGGSGSNCGMWTAEGGEGGGLTGGSGCVYSCSDCQYTGSGGTQFSGGIAGPTGHGLCGGNQNGSLGQGGSNNGDFGTGGGGGYYGGGSGCFEGAGGGSSYAYGLATFVTHTQGVRLGNGQVIITPLATCTPTTITPDVANLPDVTGECSVTPSTPTATNDCGDVYNGVPNVTFPVTTQGTTTVTWTYDDGQGNTTTQTQDIIVDDITNPTPLCQSISVNLDATGNASILASQVDNGSSDNCGIASIAVSPNTFNCTNLGANAVTLTVTDVNGNTSTCPATVTVVDATAPDYSYGSGTLVDPFVTTSASVLATYPTGVYYFHINGSTFQANVDNTTAGGGWILVLNYVHQGGTNPALNIRTSDLPIQTGAGLGANEAGSAAWGHAGNALMTSLNPTELRFYGQTSAHGRIINFTTNLASAVNYTKTGVGSMAGINNPANYTLLAGHTANIPQTASSNYVNEGNLAMTNFPYWLSATYHWGIQGLGNRWEVDDFPNGFGNNTIHRVWGRNTNPPVYTPLAPITAECTATPTAPVVDDNCAGSVTGTPDVTFPITTQGTTTVTWTYNDGNGNISTQTQNVVIDDVTPPTITCIANPTVNTDAGLCTYAVTGTEFDPATINDNCAGFTYSNNINGTSSLVGEAISDATVITWTVNDIGGNTAQCSFTVTVDDIEDPVITCPANIAVNNDLGLCSAVVNYTIPTATDNCSAVVAGSQTFNFNGGYQTFTVPPGVTQITIEAYGAKGGDNTWSVPVSGGLGALMSGDFNVIPGDQLIILPGGIGEPGWAGTGGGGGTFVVKVDPTSTDIMTFAPFTGIAVTPLIIAGGGGAGNTCSGQNGQPGTTSLQGTTGAGLPNSSLPGNGGITGGNASGGAGFRTDGAGFNPTDIAKSFLSGSGIVFETCISDPMGGFGGGGGTSCACDGGGGGGYTGGDGGSPGGGGGSYNIGANQNNLSGINNGNGIVNIIWNLSTEPTVTQTDLTGLTTGDAFPVGTTTLEYTATDDSGNTDVCTFTVTVTDNEAPDAICQNVTVNLDAAGNGSTTAAAVNNGSDDNCGIASLSLSQTAFTCANVGPNTVTLTVTDVNTNTSTCTATVNVVDAIAPTAVCQNVTVNLDAAGTGSTAAAAVNNGSSDICGIASLGLSQTAFTCANVGSNTVTLTVTDVNSNTSTCTATVTVVDAIAPTAICQNITVPLNASGNASVMVAMINNGSNDACGLAGLSVAPNNFTCSDLGNNTVTLTVIDNNGNSATCPSTVEIIDNLAPTALCQNVTVQLNAAGNASITTAMVNNGSSDNCGVPTLSLSQSAFTCANVGVNNVTLTATDATGNSAICNAVITVQDLIAPTAICQNATISLDAAGTATLLPASINNGSTDNCAVTAVSASQTAFTCGNLGANNIVLTVSDAAGNSATCNTVVTVQDVIAPTVSCVPFTVALNASGNATVTAANVNGGSSDNCGITSLTVSPSVFTCASVATSPNTVTLTATDASGNTSSCNALVTVQDNTVPVVTCPSNITQNAIVNNCGRIINYSVGVTDNCSTTTQTDGTGLTSGSLFPVGITNQSYVITDAGGNTVNCNFTVTILDVQNPVITGCPSSFTVSTDLNKCDAAVFWTAPTASDNCSGVVLTATILPGSTFLLGTTAVTYTATDASGLTATCTFNVTVQDTQFPTITCPANIAVNNDAGLCSAVVVSLGTEVTTDNCTVASVSNNGPVTGIYPVGVNTVVWSVTDGAGNTTTCNQLVTVTDNEAPEALCQDVTVALDVLGNGSTTAIEVNDGSNDNCAIATLALSDTDFTCADVATSPNTVTLTVTDVNGNVSTCTAGVTVIDNIAPVADCQNITINLNAAGTASITTADIDGNSDDACGVTLSASQTAFTCANLGANTVTLTVTDPSMNSSTCLATVTVVDAIAPIIACQNMTVQLDATGNATITAGDVTASATDNCTITSSTIDISTFNCTNVGTPVTVTLTVTDQSSNASTCTSTITVEDNVAPAAVCQNVDVFLDVNGDGSTTAALVNNGSSDACGIASLVLSDTDFTCADVATSPNTVTLTVTDVNGNVSTCTAGVTVIDNIAPNAVCQDITIDLDGTGNVTILDTDIDGGSTDACGIATYVASQTTFDCSEIGANNVTLTLTDVNGNVSSCGAIVTVVDPLAPVITCPADFTVSNDPGLCSASSVAFGLATATDNCTAVVITNDAPAVFPFGPTTITWTATDAYGNTASCPQIVTVEDVENPMITCPTDITVSADAGLCTASAVALGLESTSDNCAVATVTNDAPVTFALGTTMVTWTVTDVEGNSATCNQFVTVVDTEAPAIVCAPAVTVPALFGSCNALGVVLGTPITSDNCTVATVSNNGLVSYPLGTTTVTWTVTDLAGNSTSCTQTVTVIDTQLPTIACPSNVTVPADLGLCTASGVVLGTPATADNCTTVTTSNNAPATFPLGTTNVTWTVVDGSTNTATCVQTVTVLDTQLPTIACPVAVTSTTDAGLCTSSTVVLGLATAGDNCSIGSVTNNAPAAFPLGATTVTWTVVDGSGNTATCTQTVTVNDNELPTIACPVNVTVPADLGVCTASGVALGTPTTADNCSVASVTNNAPATYPLGATTVVWTIVDGSTNSATCLQTVTVVDTQLPTIACPVNVTVPADFGTCTAIGVALGTPVIADNCSVLPATNNGLAVYPLGNTTVTWTVVDGSGNSASCTQTVTVIDTQVPTITCPVAVTVPADLGVCTATGVALGLPIDNDNCSVASVTNNGLTTYPLGNTTVTWTVVDGSGNSATCTQTVTVIDTQAPIVTCPAAVTVPADLGSCTATGVVLGTPSVTENCSVASITNNAPAVYPLGVTTVIWTVVDGSGNTTFCTQFVTVVDTQLPTIACPATVTVPADAGLCVATGVALGTPTTTDNCVATTVSNNAPAAYPLGNTTVTWTVADGSGNTATCAQVVTVIDTQLPTIACPVNVSVAANAGSCVATGVVLGSPVTADNCSVASVTNNGLTTYPLGTTNVTWTVVDGSGNPQTCVQTVTVVDTQVPTIACPANVTVSTAGGSCTATTVALGTPVTADNCSVATVTNNAPAVFALGVTPVIWTVVDGSGNVATCTQNVTVVDNQNPIIACPFPVTVTTNTGCTATGVSLGTPTTADNCSVATVTNNAPAAFALGTTTVIWTVTDGSGNTATCTQTVTVTDNVLPTITCPAPVVVNAAAGTCTVTGVALGTPTTADNCTVASVTNNAPSVYGLGTTAVTWTVVDGSGNVATCTQTVTVNDTQLPTIACPTNVTAAADLGSCVAVGTALGTPATADNCSVASVTNNAPASYPLGNTTVTWTVADGSGNTATCTQVVTVIDTQAPTILCAAPMTVDTDPGVCTTTMTLLTPSTADNCSVATVTSNAPATFPLGTTVVTWTVVDGSGNTTTCTQSVTVEDNELPTIACQSDITLNNLPGFCGRSVNYAVPAFADNCGVASFTQTDGSGYVAGDLFPIGTTYQEFTVVDNSGNSFTCGFNITIVDNELPVLANCPADIVSFINEAGQCEKVVTWQNPTASDNCPGVDLTQDYFSGSSFPIGTTVVTYNVTDNSGNTATCSFSVTVVDQANPIVTVVGETKLTVNVTGATYQWVDCDNNYAPIAGATASTFSPTSNGNYAVIVNTGGCPDTSNCESISVIGIEEVVSFGEIVLYPNPSYNGSFMISYEGVIEAIMVYDMTGREVGVEVDLNAKSVNGSELASGKYMVRILTQNQLITKELIVVKGE